MGASILLSFADTSGNFGLLILHAEQEQFAFSVSAFPLIAQFSTALFPELVFTLHFHLCSDSSREKRVRNHRSLVDVYYFHACVRCILL